VLITATASDDRGVSKVEFWIDGRRRDTDRRAPYRYNWSPGRVYKTFRIEVRAYDASGKVATDTITVRKVRASSSWHRKRFGR
jgi:hypothetical protein